MPSIRITSFGGINTEISPRLAPANVAQVAHNCLLWDGRLRPLAKWVKVQGVDLDIHSIALSPTDVVRTSELREAVFLSGEKYVEDTKVGLEPFFSSIYDANVLYTHRATSEPRYVGIRAPGIALTTSVSYERAYHSDKPVNRMYAVSAIRRAPNGVEESTLSLLPNQSPQSILYEGDNATIALNIIAQIPYEYDGFRLYRSISGMDTGLDTANELDTDWYLVGEFAGGTGDGIIYGYTYIDGGSATTDALDAYLAKDFYPPRRYSYKYLQNTESGWLVAASDDGKINVSERYLYHAWPIENFYSIPDVVISGMKTQFDTAFIGTNSVPYMMALAPGEKLGLQSSITPFPESYPCLPGTMDRTASGAMYASSSGIIALSREGMRRTTAGVASGVTPLYTIVAQETVTIDEEEKEISRAYPMRFEHTVHGAYLRGEYFGFCRITTKEIIEEVQQYLFKGYIFNTGSSIDGGRELQKLVTMDTPADIRAHAIGGKGLYVLSSEGVFWMPTPDAENEQYIRANKYCYEWKSKKFVFPGEMAMAACKVVHDCKGFVRVKFYVDCCCTYECIVHDCEPFTLPPHMVGVTWEIALEGTSVVDEVHVASSIRELIEHESGA